jgi:hypothetical protein
MESYNLRKEAKERKICQRGNCFNVKERREGKGTGRQKSEHVKVVGN